MSIKQFNGEWVCKEDRMLFRFNTHEDQEFSFWLTRFVVKGLIQGAQQLTVKALEQVHPPQVAQVMQSFQQESLTQQLNFQQTYQAAKDKPMGQAPLLVTGLQLKQEGESVSIRFDLDTGQAVHVQVSASVLQILLALLDKLQTTAQWGVGMNDASLESTMSLDAHTPTLVH
jgi:hypothetical protein